MAEIKPCNSIVHSLFNLRAIVNGRFCRLLRAIPARHQWCVYCTGVSSVGGTSGGISVFVAVRVGDCVLVGFGVFVEVLVGVDVFVGVLVRVGVLVGVLVFVGVGVSVNVGVGEGVRVRVNNTNSGVFVYGVGLDVTVSCRLDPGSV